MNRSLWIFFVLASAALCAPVREVPRDAPFQLESAVACRGQQDGYPVEAGTEFAAGERALYVWFAGQAGTRDTPLEAVVSRGDPPRVVAVRRLCVPRGSDGGVVSLALDGRGPLPAGAYRVALTGGGCARVVTFEIVPASEPVRLECLSDGFSLVPPPGWRAVAREDVALVLQRAAPPDASALVMVRHEPRAIPAAEVADQIVAAMAGDGSCRVLRRVTTAVAGRASVALVVRMPDGGLTKIVVVPREASDRARAFFGVIVSAGAGRFPAIEAEFDGMLETFRVVAPRLP